MYFDRALSLGEIRSLQFHPRVLSGCVLYSHYGFNGTGTQPDWSGKGNSGTVTGATVSNHVPLGSPFGFDDPLPYIVTPSSVVPLFEKHYRMLRV